MAERGGERAKNNSNSNAANVSREDIQLIAQKVAAQSLQVPESVWGVLTAISDKARKRPQGLHILLNANEHVLGRLVKEPTCRIDSLNVSGTHCKITRTVVKNGNSNNPSFLVFVKDSSSNGTFINWEKLKRDSSEVQIQHGDIISLVSAPEHESAFAFVYREVSRGAQKRKASIADGGECFRDVKRMKGIGIGGPEGPVQLDDVRRLQKSNEDLRQQLEAHVLTIEKLHAKARDTNVQHGNELKSVEEKLSASFSEKIRELQDELTKKVTEIDNLIATSAQQQQSIEDLKRQLSTAKQSRSDAEEIIQNQKTAISELTLRLEEERDQRRDERERAKIELQTAIERIRVEYSEEMKRQSDIAAQHHKEQLDVINKLQESDKENRMLIETLRSKLDDVREDCMRAEKRAHGLEVKLHEEEMASSAAKRKVLEREHELQRMRKQLESEKAAREDAWAKVAALELQMAAAIRDLKLEKQRLEGARERIVLRETQLRAFHSTAEEIAALQRKQQEQLNSMLKTLEDGEDYDLPCTENGFQTETENLYREVTKAREEVMAANIGSEGTNVEKDIDDHAHSPKDVTNGDRESDSSSIKNCNSIERKSGEAMEEDGNGDTQEEESERIAEALPKPCVHDTEATGAMLNNDYENIGTEKMFATDAETTQLLDNTCGSRLEILGGVNAVGGDAGNEDDREALGETMQIDEEEDGTPLETERKQHEGNDLGLELVSQNRVEPDKLSNTDKCIQEYATTDSRRDNNSQNQRPVEGYLRDKNRKRSPNTADLLASEAAGSWLESSAHSDHCDNESLRSDAREPGTRMVPDEGVRQDFEASQVGEDANRSPKKEQNLNSLESHDTDNEIAVAGSQNSPLSRFNSRRSLEHQTLDAMINIVAPDFKRSGEEKVDADDIPATDEETEEDDSDNGDAAAAAADEEDDDDDDDTQQDSAE